MILNRVPGISLLCEPVRFTLGSLFARQFPTEMLHVFLDLPLYKNTSAQNLLLIYPITVFIIRIILVSVALRYFEPIFFHEFLDYIKL
jgi:hypothetical protein